MPYVAPVKDMLFVMNELAGLSEVVSYPSYAKAGADTDLASAILEESAKFNQDVVAPLNWPGDQHPSSLKDGLVTTTPGFKDAFEQFGAAGWQGIVHPAEFGGQGLPKLIATACFEMVHSASLSFALCPMLTDGAIEALLTAASPELQERYVPKMISGEWTGTMCLTEPQAGSDLSMVRSRAVPDTDGAYKIFGTKIYITYGEHDMAKNIAHLVLARTPDAPEGVKGISLFVVPKFLVNADGSLGERNDVYCVSIEHKLGIKASPTAVLQFGDHSGASGYLVGEQNRGLEYMFIMMNAARFAVGMQGIAVAERAYQKAVQYAKDRVQNPSGRRRVAVQYRGEALPRHQGQAGAEGICLHPHGALRGLGPPCQPVDLDAPGAQGVRREHRSLRTRGSCGFGHARLPRCRPGSLPRSPRDQRAVEDPHEGRRDHLRVPLRHGCPLRLRRGRSHPRCCSVQSA